MWTYPSWHGFTRPKNENRDFQDKSLNLIILNKNRSHTKRTINLSIGIYEGNRELQHLTIVSRRHICFQGYCFWYCHEQHQSQVLEPLGRNGRIADPAAHVDEYAILRRALAGSFPGVVAISCLVERPRRSVDPAGEEAGNRNVDFHGRRHFRALVCQYAHDEICGLTACRLCWRRNRRHYRHYC